MKYEIRNMGMIGNRQTGALIDLYGDICWYCPNQFDGPSFFGSLLDDEKGGKPLAVFFMENPCNYRWLTVSANRTGQICRWPAISGTRQPL